MSRKYLPRSLREKVRSAADHRCGYCLARQKHSNIRLEVEHIIPVAKGGTNEEVNLWLSCVTCNKYKSENVVGFDGDPLRLTRFFNPRNEDWHNHFEWSEDGLSINGRTSIGRVTVVALKLNNELQVEVRGFWITARVHPMAE